MASPNDVSSLLSSIASAGASFGHQNPGAREKLLSLTYKLASALETPSGFIQRVGWAEVCSITYYFHYLLSAAHIVLNETLKASKIRRHANGD